MDDTAGKGKLKPIFGGGGVRGARPCDLRGGAFGALLSLEEKGKKANIACD